MTTIVAGVVGYVLLLALTSPPSFPTTPMTTGVSLKEGENGLDHVYQSVYRVSMNAGFLVDLDRVAVAVVPPRNTSVSFHILGCQLEKLPCSTTSPFVAQTVAEKGPLRQERFPGLQVGCYESFGPSWFTDGGCVFVRTVFEVTYAGSDNKPLAEPRIEVTPNVRFAVF